MRGMDEEVRKEEEGAAWEREKRQREERDREKTRKNREKRERLKRKKGGNKTGEGEATEGAGKGGKVKARVVVREGAEGLGGEGNGDEEMRQEAAVDDGELTSSVPSPDELLADVLAVDPPAIIAWARPLISRTIGSIDPVFGTLLTPRF